MNEDWLKDIHDKMSNYEEDEPRGLWDDICRARMLEEKKKKNGRAKAAVWLWTKRMSSVAALIALVITVGYYINKDAKAPQESLITRKLPSNDFSKGENNTASHDEFHEEYSPSTANIKSGTQAVKSLAEAVTNVLSSPNVISDTVTATSADANVSSTEHKVAESTPDVHLTKQQKRYDENVRGSYQDNYIKTGAYACNDNSGRFSFSVFTSGSTGYALNRKSTGESVGLGFVTDKSDLEDCPMLGILVNNQGKEVEKNIKHHLPVKAGVSFTYKLNGRFSLESGVTYTYLMSDVRDGSSSDYFTGEQILRYIGIPFNIKINILSWKELELYASSGVLAEKCVSGSMKKEYVLDSQTKKTETNNLNVKPFQWSVNTSAGAQYNITPSVGIYAEPGMSYYFNDGTSIKTIYKDKPLNFNFNFGIRFTFGNK